MPPDTGPFCRLTCRLPDAAAKIQFQGVLVVSLERRDLQQNGTGKLSQNAGRRLLEYLNLISTENET